MFSEDEIEALVLGSRSVAQRSDEPLGKAARNALAKIVAVLPQDMRDDVDTAGLLVGPGETMTAGETRLPTIRLAIRTAQQLQLRYVDREGEETQRMVWPFALGFFDRAWAVAAWCELRQSIDTSGPTGLWPSSGGKPRRRRAMLKEWRAAEGVAGRDFTADRSGQYADLAILPPGLGGSDA